MRTIWKFPLDFTRAGEWSGSVEMPRGAAIVHFAVEFRGPIEGRPRQGVPTIWAEVDSEQPKEPARFQILGTGHPIPEGAEHVGTFDAEPFVWHVFDLRRAVDIPAELRPFLPDFPAVNAYRLLVKEGFTLRDDKAWIAPSDEPLSHEQTLAVGELQQHGFGSVVGA